MIKCLKKAPAFSYEEKGCYFQGAKVQNKVEQTSKISQKKFYTFDYKEYAGE